MNAALNLILMTRDKDLRRWGRFPAVLMLFLGCFILCSALYSYHLTESRLEPTLRSAQNSEQKLIGMVADEEIRSALKEGQAWEQKSTEHLLDAARAVILGGGISFAIISFYTAALAWRSYELASAGPEDSEEDREAGSEPAQQPDTPAS